MDYLEQDWTYWQPQKIKFVDRAKHMLDTSLLSDVEFLVGDKEEVFRAHKTFLVMSSPVFETTFPGPVPQPQPVKIPDIQPATFKHLLQYIYIDSIDLESLDDAVDLIYAAEKYMIPSLSSRCIDYMINNPSNLFRVLEYAVLTENAGLKSECSAILMEINNEGCLPLPLLPSSLSVKREKRVDFFFQTSGEVSINIEPPFHN